MTIYYLHQLLPDGDFIEDLEGADFPDFESVQREAVLAAREIICDLILRGEPFEGGAFHIADASGRILARLPFEHALARRRPPPAIDGRQPAAPEASRT